MRKESMFRRLGLAVASAAACAFIALPALAEPPSHGFNTRAPRPVVNPAPHVHAPHALHKPPPGFAPILQDHPAHPAHPQLVANQKPSVVVHVRSPHVNRSVTPSIKVPRQAHGRTVHIIAHQTKNEAKPPIVLPGPAPKVPVQHASKTTL